jgi:hypothetical protein
MHFVSKYYSNTNTASSLRCLLFSLRTFSSCRCEAEPNCGPQAFFWFLPKLSRYSDLLRARRSGDRIPVWGGIFRTRPDRPCVPPSLVYMGTVSFPGVKRPGRGVDHPPSSDAEVKERIELYHYTPSGPSWPVLGRTLLVPFTLYVHLSYICRLYCEKNQFV